MSTFSGKCQPFQENDNFFRKQPICKEKRCQPFQEKRQLSVNQNQEKTFPATRYSATVQKPTINSQKNLLYLYINIRNFPRHALRKNKL